MELILARPTQEAALQCRQRETASHLCGTVIFPSAEKEKTPLPHGGLCPTGGRRLCRGPEPQRPQQWGLISENGRSKGGAGGWVLSPLRPPRPAPRSEPVRAPGRQPHLPRRPGSLPAGHGQRALLSGSGGVWPL